MYVIQKRDIRNSGLHILSIDGQFLCHCQNLCFFFFVGNYLILTTLPNNSFSFSNIRIQKLLTHVSATPCILLDRLDNHSTKLIISNDRKPKLEEAQI